MAETATIEMQDRELFAAMAMQALITRGERWAADLIAKQAVAYADALIVALAAIAPKPPAESPSSISKKIVRSSFSCHPARVFCRHKREPPGWILF